MSPHFPCPNCAKPREAERSACASCGYPQHARKTERREVVQSGTGWLLSAIAKGAVLVVLALVVTVRFDQQTQQIFEACLLILGVMVPLVDFYFFWNWDERSSS